MFKGVTVKSKEEVKTCRVGCGLMHDKGCLKVALVYAKLLSGCDCIILSCTRL